MRMGIGEKEKTRNFVSPILELAIVIRDRLVLVKSPRAAQIEACPGARVGGIFRRSGRNQPASVPAAKLVALDVEQFQHYRINRGGRVSEPRHRKRSRRAVDRQYRNYGADDRPRRKPACLPRPLITEEQGPASGLVPQRPADAASKEILPYHRSRFSFCFLEELIGIQV